MVLYLVSKVGVEVGNSDGKTDGNRVDIADSVVLGSKMVQKLLFGEQDNVDYETWEKSRYWYSLFVRACVRKTCFL